MEKTGISYKQQQPTGNYDAIVIGSGIGGMGTAVFLAKEGKRVLILERHYTAGGFTHVFKRKDYEWDVGIHYIGEVSNKHSPIYAIFDYVTDGKMEWADMGEVYDKIIFGDKHYDFVKGKQNWIKKMKGYFPAPEDQVAIDKYVKLIIEATGAVKGFAVGKALPNAVAWAARPFVQRKFLKYASRTTKEVLDELTDNKELIGVLTGQYGDHGLTPEKSSFGMHAMIVKHYFRGGNYPVGGSSVIAKYMSAIIEKSGGQIFTNAAVEEILVKNGKAYGVKMADGNEFTAETIISNAGFYNTFEKLLPASLPEIKPYKELNKKVTASAAHLTLYIGLQHTAEELNLPKANYWIYPDNYDHDENLENYLTDNNAPLPVVYLSFPGAKDPDFTNRFPGRSAIEVITFAPYENFKKWEDTRWKHRGEDYDDYKEKISQQLLEQLYKHIPQVKGKIDTYELSTPLSTKHFSNYQSGEIYGLTHSPERFSEKLLQPTTKIDNLFLTGQDILTAGIGGALFAGLLTASSILKRNLTNDVIKAIREKAEPVA